MSNELVTKFIFDETEASRRIELTEKRLVNLDTRLNGFGQNPTFGRGLNTFFDALNKKVNQFETNLQSAGKTDLKSLGNDLLKQSQIEKSLEQTKRAKVQTLTEEVKLERQKLGLLSDQLKLERQKSSKPADPLKAALADIKRYQAETAKGETDLTRLIERQSEKQYQARIKSFQRGVNDFSKSNSGGSSKGTSGGDFGDSFGNRVLGADFGSAAFLGGIAGGAVVAGVGIVKDAVSSLVGEVKDLSVQSIKLAGDFEETTNSLAVFAGSTNAAKRELSEIDKVALNTPGLGLVDAEKGYQRLRALNFQAKISQDLIKGLGTQRVLSGATSDSVDRVITNLIQLTSGAGTAQDVRQTVGQLPTLLPVFKKAFGTQDFGEINKIAAAKPDEFIKKFSEELGKAQTAQAGLNVTLEKGGDAVTAAGRKFGEPFLQPLTRDADALTKALNENAESFAALGQVAADTYNGISLAARGFESLKGNDPKAGSPILSVLGSVLSGAKNGVGALTGGFSNTLIDGTGQFLGFLKNSGQAERLKTEAAAQAKTFKQAFDSGSTTDGLKFAFDDLTNTFKTLPSLADKLETEKAAAQAKELKDEIKKVKSELSEFTFKVAGDDISQNLELNKAIAVRDAKGDSLKLTRETAALEIAALREQISLSDRSTVGKLQNLKPEDFTAGKNLLIVQENAANIGKLNAQIQLTLFNAQKQQTDEAKKITDEFRATFVSLKSVDNPLVKQFSDIETASERARLKFGAFGDDVVNKIAAIEKANLTKAINLQRFGNDFAALKFDQDARKLAATPERQFADFARKLELVNRKVEFVSTTNDLSRKISEAEFYANKFNPNNPKSFAEFNRRGPNDDISDAGISIRNAVSDIRDLKNIGTGGTGLDGKEAVINKILDSIPPRDELLKRLNSPNLRGDSQSLLDEQAQALRIKKDIERNKFNNFLEDQKTAEFGKVFAREQIGLINKSGLTDIEKAQQRLSVADALGNDLDAGLKRQKIQDFVASAAEKRNDEKEALQISRDLKDLVAGLVRQLTEKGIKTDAVPAQVNVTLNGVNADVSQNNDFLPTRPQGGAKTKDAEYGSPEFFQNAFNSFK